MNEDYIQVRPFISFFMWYVFMSITIMQESSTELPHLAWIGFLFLLSFGVLDISERERERGHRIITKLYWLISLQKWGKLWNIQKIITISASRLTVVIRQKWEQGGGRILKMAPFHKHFYTFSLFLFFVLFVKQMESRANS